METAATFRLVSMDLCEVNPLVDVPSEMMHGDDRDLKQTTQTTHLAMELVCFALGQTILGHNSQPTTDRFFGKSLETAPCFVPTTPKGVDAS